MEYRSNRDYNTNLYGEVILGANCVFFICFFTVFVPLPKNFLPMDEKYKGEE
jgi:hypothetical protein